MRSIPAILVLLVTLMFGGAMNLLHDCPQRASGAGAVEWVACDADAGWACGDTAGAPCRHAMGAIEDGDDAPVVVNSATAKAFVESSTMTRTAPVFGACARVPDSAPRPPRA